jgi:hypothetical protein
MPSPIPKTARQIIEGTQPHQVEPCPKCKALAGWYEHRRQSGRAYFYTTGEITHYVEGHTWHGPRKYCVECDRDITHLIR